MNSQDKVIKAHLMAHRTITSWEAINKYRITRLSAVIHRLKNLLVAMGMEALYSIGTID